MERASFHLLVILLVFSHLMFSSNAVPSTRTERLLDGSGELRALSDAPQSLTTIEDGNVAAEFVNVRMDLEVNDYPGSGANNRHTPKPPAKQ